MYIVHMGTQYWVLEDSDGESRFPQIAMLRSVCWLEIHASFPNTLPGTYEIVWRLDMPSESAANFNCDWSATVKDPNDQILSLSVLMKHDKNPEWSQRLIQRGWFEITVGRIEVLADGSSVTCSMFGGNPHWFYGLRLDYALLRPINPEENEPEYPFIVLEREQEEYGDAVESEQLNVEHDDVYDYYDESEEEEEEE
jgi:hypothetical protein